MVTNRLLTGSLALPAIEVLARTSPLAAIQAFVCAVVAGEVQQLAALVRSSNAGLLSGIAVLVGNGLLAFVLNVASFQTNKLAGALTMTVSGNLKQCLTVALGIMCFNVRVEFSNAVGMVITMIGAAMYSKAELDSKRQKSRVAPDVLGVDGLRLEGVSKNPLGRLGRRAAILLAVVVLSPLSLFMLQSHLDTDLVSQASGRPSLRF